MFDVGTLAEFEDGKHYLLNVTSITNMVFDGDPNPKENLPFSPQPGVLYTVDHKTFTQCIEPTKMFKLGAIIEVSDSGEKLDKDNPNILTQEEIESFYGSSHIGVEKKRDRLEKVTSHFTLGRIHEFMKENDDIIPASLMNYLEGRLNEMQSRTPFVDAPPDEEERRFNRLVNQ